MKQHRKAEDWDAKQEEKRKVRVVKYTGTKAGKEDKSFAKGKK